MLHTEWLSTGAAQTAHHCWTDAAAAKSHMWVPDGPWRDGTGCADGKQCSNWRAHDQRSHGQRSRLDQHGAACHPDWHAGLRCWLGHWVWHWAAAADLASPCSAVMGPGWGVGACKRQHEYSCGCFGGPWLSAELMLQHGSWWRQTWLLCLKTV